ncbi:hypothetical protein [Loktanella sp. IMCC34160]|uniref:hypothetical protein n=1 Tax=Loktanella sp. IMCC34160 TaxID=2510646 RepID=UPI0013EC8029|nr:hypothetical protein [Loktanella sp. IMCC34160]
MRGLFRAIAEELFRVRPRRHVITRYNTVDLSDDLDDLYLLSAIERTFDITFAEGEAQRVYTVGEMVDLVAGKTGGDPDLVFARLTVTIQEFTGIDFQVDRDTTFFAKVAKPREQGRKP